MTGGRPLRFLALLLGGWTGMRAFALYRDGDATALVAPIAAAVAAAAEAIGIAPAAAADVRAAIAGRAVADPPQEVRRSGPIAPTTVTLAERQQIVRAPLPLPPVDPPHDPPASFLPIALPPPIARGPSRLAGSAWGIVRGGDLAQATGGQLGGSQAGLRLTYALGRARRIALAVRISAPLAGRGAEAAVGIDWQPLQLPLHIVAERRIALDAANSGAKGGTMLGIVGGFGPSPIAGEVTLEGYAQAGLIARDDSEAFIDGALRVAHPIARIGNVRFDLGAGAWGGAQRGAARLDLGPSLGARVPVGGRSLRLTADWRQRIAGDARPGSGPALSIGSDF